MNKQKSRSSQSSGVFKGDSIKDVAETIGLAGISDAVASALAGDVEYRLHQVVEEASHFMRHARRTTLTTSDIDQALRVLNIEPLYGHSANAPPNFRRALPFPQTQSAGTVYFVEDEEIDFDRVLREEKVALPRPVSWRAHWLAVEGVQPLVPENPPAVPRDAEPLETKASPRPANANTTFPLTPPSPSHPSAAKKATPHQSQGPHQQQQQLVKQVLSRELQLYYTRLTSALLPPNPSEYAKRAAALASLRADAGLQALLPYLIRWVGEGVVGALREGGEGEAEGRTLEVLMEVIAAILENQTLFVEPYLHQLLPPILSTLLHSALPPSHASALRTAAAQTLSRILTQHSTTYPSLSPRIMKTLLLALVAPGKSRGTREGAIRGLGGVGKEAIRKGLVEGGGARVVGEELMDGETGPLVDAVLSAFQVFQPRSSNPVPLRPSDSDDSATMHALRETVGDFFSEHLFGDAVWARGVLRADASSDLHVS